MTEINIRVTTTPPATVEVIADPSASVQEAIAAAEAAAASEAAAAAAETAAAGSASSASMSEAAAAASAFAASGDADAAMASATAADASADAAAASAAAAAAELNQALKIDQNLADLDNAATARTNLGTNASNVPFTQAGAGATARTVAAKLGEVVSVKDFGAVGDGVTDDTAAILAAVAAHDVIYLPQGTYLTTGTIALDRAGQCLRGDGKRRTEIRISSTTLPAITLATGIADYTVHGLRVGRTGTPVSGADGIKFLGTTDNSEISDVTCEGHWDGLVIGTCDTGLLREVRCRANLRDGINQTNSAVYGPSQWEAQDILVDRNVRDGWHIESTAGPAGMILGTMNSVKSFANSARGIHLIGNSTTPIFDLRLVNAFLGSDGFGSIRLDTYGGKHRINGFFERNGRDATGPTVSTAATGTAPGIEITANNADVTVYGSTIDDNAYDGIEHDGGILIVSGCNIFNNGQSLTAGRRNGILSEGGRLIVGAGSIVNLGGNTTQLFGIATTHSDVVIAGNDISNNTTLAVSLGATTNAFVMANAPAASLLGRMAGIIDVVQFNSAFTPGVTGGNAGSGTINVGGGLLKNNVAYTNP